MAASATDYFGTARPTIRSRAPSGIAAAVVPSPGSPRTPLLGRSLSSQFGSPSGFRSEQEDQIIYELGARHLSAGFAGESRPRCVIRFDPESGRRVGDYRAYDPAYKRRRRKAVDDEDWAAEYELYRVDLRTLDLGLVEDKLERAVRKVHVDYLQLDQKPRKAVLTIPSILPTPLLEIAMKVLFNHFAQPPTVTVFTTPLLACVSAGLRNALVVDVGWEETVVTAVGEYKEVFQRRSVRAGKMLTREMARMLIDEVKHQENATNDEDVDAKVNFEYAEEVTQRMAWCKPRHERLSSKAGDTGLIELPSPDSDSQTKLHVPFTRLADPAESALFASSPTHGHDDHDLPLHLLAYRVLLALHSDLRALCISRTIVTGGLSRLPGLKHRLLQEIVHLVETRGWDPVENYGSATAHHERILQERSANIAARRQQHEQNDFIKPALSSSAKKPVQDSIPHADRIHDDKHDIISQKAEREAQRGKVEPVKGVVRGVETLGAWAGASLTATLRVKGVFEVEREEFLKHGLKEGGGVII